MNSLICLSLLAFLVGASAQALRAPGRPGLLPINAPSLPGAGGGMEAMGKMMLKAVDKDVMNKQTSEILKTALTSGLKHLNAKSQKTSGRKDEGGLDDDAKQAIKAYLEAIGWIIKEALHFS